MGNVKKFYDYFYFYGKVKITAIPRTYKNSVYFIQEKQRFLKFAIDYRRSLDVRV